MTAYKPHKAMKDSGVPWLGQIPSRWAVAGSRRMFRERKTEALPDDVLLTASQKYGMIPQAEFMTLEGRRVVELDKGRSNLIHVEPGDFVISLRSFQGGLELSRTAGSITFHYVPITPMKWVHTPFFAYVLKSSTYIQALRATANLIRDGQDMRFTHFAQVPLPVVPMEEQAIIANHLNRETARIDNLIARKKRFIELLGEKRQVLITHVVTKGLNPNAKMKDSTVEWIGKVPAHWALHDFWTIAQQVSIIGLPNEGLLSVYLDRGVIPYSEGGGLVHKPAESLEDYQLVEPGNFVLNNQQAWRGSVGVSKYRGIVSPAYLIFRLSSKVVPDFANYLFRTPGFADQMMLSSQGVGDIQRQIKWAYLRKVLVALPSLEEQKSIVIHLERSTSRIDALVAKTELSIELLREHRIALITAAVTGKIDLREAA